MAIVSLIVAALIAVVDQIIKYFVVIYLEPVSSVVAIPYILELTYYENSGVAFGMFKDNRWIFVALTSIVIIAFVVLLFKNGRNSKLFSIAATLIIGGGIGNLIDRLVYGFVVDYLSLSFFPPVCNFADYCITAGTILLVIYLLFYSEKSDTKKLEKKEK